MPKWTVEPLNARVERELSALPAECQARYLYISEMLCDFGPQQVGMPHVRPLGEKLWEMRPSTARVIYTATKRRRLVVLRAFIKKAQRTPKREIDLARARAREIK